MSLPFIKKTFSILAACFGATVLVSGQPYKITWYTIDGGGGTSTGGTYVVNGTIGQPDAGTLAGGNYTLIGGFWGVVAAVQTPGAPHLSITRSGTEVIISWPAPSTGFVLEQNVDLGTSTWSGVPEPVMQVGNENRVVVPSPVGMRYFRLRHP